MKRRKGFTLLELLIAAALVAVLTVFATQSFRRAKREILAEDAKRVADVIAAAAYRYKIAYSALSGNCADVLPTLKQKGFVESRVSIPTGYSCSLSVDPETKQVMATLSGSGLTSTYETFGFIPGGDGWAANSGD